MRPPDAAAATPAGAGATGPSLPRLVAYGGLRMPLALLELPLFVLLPNLYSQVHGMDLALIGAILLGTRLLDAFADPVIGVAIDRSRGRLGYRGWILRALPVLALGFAGLLLPPVAGGWLAAWLVTASLVTYLAYSVVSIAYMGWGAELGSTPAERARVTAVREGFGLVGVLAAAALLVPEQVRSLTLAFVALAVIGAALLTRAPLPAPAAAPAVPIEHGLGASWRTLRANGGFRWLLAIFLVNGVASAIPATLVLFFVGDVLGAPERAPAFLGTYFLAGAVGMPLWVWAARRIGLRSTWLVGMAFSVLAFVWALGLGRGDTGSFLAICVLTGLALGADLAMPPALLATVIASHGDAGRREGAYFGVWNLATKLVLALAAGIALPLLGALGYRPGEPGSDTLALSLTYAALPCLMKLVAGAVLILAPIQEPTRT